jgi:citrate lyase gamma subunit
MLTSSKKAKGKKLQNTVAEAIRTTFNLSDKDVTSTIMGDSGIDIKLSEEARKKFGYAIECKNLARIAIYKHWAQAKANAEKEKLEPLLVIKQNRSEPLVVLTLEKFMELIK